MLTASYMFGWMTQTGMGWLICLFGSSYESRACSVQKYRFSMYTQILMISCTWFVLVARYKLAYERLLSRFMIWSPHWYELLWAWDFHHIYHIQICNLPCIFYAYAQISIISCPWFGLVGGYKLAYKILLSRVMIWSPRWYELLWVWDFIIY
jgi:hypothetical protein